MAGGRSAIAPAYGRYGSGVACGSFLVPRRAAGADGGGTTGPRSPSGASSRSTTTGAWSLGPRPLRAWRSTQAERLQLGERRPLGRGDVGLPDVRLRVEDVLVGRRDVHVAADDRPLRVGGD